MKTDAVGAGLKPDQVEFTHDYEERYVSTVAGFHSLWDFLIVSAGLPQSKTVPGKVIFQQGLRMSPQTAKSLLFILRDQVANYEKEFGAINIAIEVKSEAESDGEPKADGKGPVVC